MHLDNDGTYTYIPCSRACNKSELAWTGDVPDELVNSWVCHRCAKYPDISPDITNKD